MYAATGQSSPYSRLLILHEANKLIASRSYSPGATGAVEKRSNDKKATFSGPDI
jgi:hypothetical protein